MSAGRVLAVAVLGLLLTTTLATGNVVTASHQTVLDPGFVKDTIEDEGAYELFENVTTEAVGGNVTTGTEGTDSLLGEDVGSELVPEEYVQDQAEANVDRFYGYLHGNRDEPGLYVDTTPVKERVPGLVAARVENASIEEFLGESTYEVGPVSIDTSLLARLSEGPDAYDDAKAEFHRTVREQVIAALVDRAFEEATDDQLLYLVVDGYNPLAYTDAEKSQMVDDREDEIRAALRERILEERGDEVDRLIDERMDEARTALTENASAAGLEGVPPEATEAALDLQTAYVTALTTDMTYEEFRADADAARSALGEALGAYARERLDEEVPDRMDLLQGGTPEQLERAADAVGILDLLGVVLPLAVPVLVGLIWLASRSVATTATTAGWSALVAGAPTYLMLGWLRDRVAANLPGSQPEVESLVLGVLERVLGVLGGQSLALALAGLLLLAGGLAVRYDQHERLREAVDGVREPSRKDVD